MAISTKEQAVVFTAPSSARQRWRRTLGPDIDGYGFILPAIIVMTCLVIYPFGLAIWFSVSDKLIGEEGHFVGLENFIYIITMDDIFLQTLRNTLIFATLSVVLKGVFGALTSPMSR